MAERKNTISGPTESNHIDFKATFLQKKPVSFTLLLIIMPFLMQIHFFQNANSFFQKRLVRYQAAGKRIRNTLKK